jgi:hypothetical protein
MQFAACTARGDASGSGLVSRARHVRRVNVLAHQLADKASDQTGNDHHQGSAITALSVTASHKASASVPRAATRNHMTANLANAARHDKGCRRILLVIDLTSPSAI